MKILSEKTHQEYATVEECLAAEKEYDEWLSNEVSKSTDAQDTPLIWR